MFGKILGFIIGRMLTRSIIGGIIGAIAGHFFIDKVRGGGSRTRTGFRGFTVGSSSMFQRQDLFFQLFFTLLGKMASEDGSISKEEETYLANLLNKMNLHGDAHTLAMDYFQKAKTNSQSFQEIANLFSQSTNHQPQLKSQLMYQLVGLASADRIITTEERNFLDQVAKIFQFPASELDHIIKSFGASDGKAYHVLGVNPQSSNEDIRKAYRTMIKEYHPDILKSKGLHPSMLEFAQTRFYDIQNAWKQIKTERQIKD